jgi:hypothetical protein
MPTLSMVATVSGKPFSWLAVWMNVIFFHLNFFKIQTTLADICEAVGFVLAKVGYLTLLLTSSAAQN